MDYFNEKIPNFIFRSLGVFAFQPRQSNIPHLVAQGHGHPETLLTTHLLKNLPLAGFGFRGGIANHSLFLHIFISSLQLFAPPRMNHLVVDAGAVGDEAVTVRHSRNQIRNSKSGKKDKDNLSVE
jgi:hypothetical protein